MPEAIWSTRYDRINEFERLLADSGTRVVKIFLQISRDEQDKFAVASQNKAEAAQKAPDEAVRREAAEFHEGTLDLDTYLAHERITARTAPVIAVPTTAGSVVLTATTTFPLNCLYFTR